MWVVVIITRHIGFVAEIPPPDIRTNSIQASRCNDLRIDYLIAKKFTEGLRYKKSPFLDESKSKITLTSWIASIQSYMEDNRMDTVFRVYDPDLNLKSTSKINGEKPKMGNFPIGSKPLEPRVLGAEPEIVYLSVTLTVTVMLRVESLCSHPSRSRSGKLLQKN